MQYRQSRPRWPRLLSAPRRLSLRAHLVSLVVAVLLPMVALAVFVGERLGHAEHDAIEQAMQQRARILALAVDREIATSVAALEVLADSDALTRAESRPLFGQASRARDMRGWLAALLVTPDGTHVANLTDSGKPGHVYPGDQEYFHDVMASARPAVSNVLVDVTTGAPIVAVAVPVVRAATITRVLVAAIDTHRLDLLLTSGDGDGTKTVQTIVDRKGAVIARSRDAEGFVGRPESGEGLVPIRASDSGRYTARTRDGKRVSVAFSRASLSGWTIAVARAADSMPHPVYAAIMQLGVPGLSLLLLSVGLAVLLARRIAVPIRAASEATTRLATGATVAPRTSGVREIALLAESLEDTRALLVKREQRLRIMSDIAAMLLSSPDPSRIVGAAFDRLARELGLDVYLSFLVRVDDPTVLELDSFAGVDADAARRLGTLRLGEAVCGTAAARRDPVVVERARTSSDPEHALIRSLGVAAYACFPLVAHGELIGALSFGTRQYDGFAPDDVSLLQTVANHLAIALQRRRLVQTLHREMAERDVMAAREREARAEAEAANRAKDEFLAMLGHELRNPLGAIRTASALLEHIATPGSNVALARDVITRQVNHVARIVDDLLDVSRVTQGKIALDRRPLDLAPAVQRHVDLLRADGRVEGHRVSVALAHVVVDADPVRLDQVIGNLLTNALKYTPPAGSIDVSVSREADTAVLRVADTGIGIAGDMLPRIFDLFVQSQHALDRAQGGLGIGLTLVRGLVEAHGGRVTAESAGVDLGSTFTVRWPVSRQAPAPPSAPASPVTTSVPPRRVVVVEDNRDSRETFVRLLLSAGHDVFSADNGQNAVELFRRVAPDVAFIDIGLPDVDGYEVARQLRALPEGRATRLVAVTGYGLADDRVHALAAGFDEHLVKPVEPGTVQRVLADSTRGPQAPSRPPT